MSSACTFENVVASQKSRTFTPAVGDTPLHPSPLSPPPHTHTHTHTHTPIWPDAAPTPLTPPMKAWNGEQRMWLQNDKQCMWLRNNE